jgi:hypothetical protein
MLLVTHHSHFLLSSCNTECFKNTWQNFWNELVICPLQSGEWAVENEMIINPAKSKAVNFTIGRVMELLNYSLWDIIIPEASSCKYLGIILRRDLNQVNYMVKKAWKALHFTMCILKKGNSNTKNTKTETKRDTSAAGLC